MMGLSARLSGLAVLLFALAACTGSDGTLGMGTPDQNETAQAPAGAADANAPGAVATTAKPLPVYEIARVYFAPIVGASVDKVAALSQRLVDAGAANGVRLVPQGTPGLTNEIKGYFSAFSENGSTTVIHVWDVVSPSGQRVHRIQGQETIPGVSPDPWTNVSPETMAAIADKVIAAYVAWVRNGT